MEPSSQFDEIQERLAALGKTLLPDKDFALSRSKDLNLFWLTLSNIEAPEQPAKKEAYDRILGWHIEQLQPPAKPALLTSYTTNIMEPSSQFDKYQERLAALGKSPLPDKNFALSRSKDLWFFCHFLEPPVPEQPVEKELYDTVLEEHMYNLKPPAKASIADNASSAAASIGHFAGHSGTGVSAVQRQRERDQAVTAKAFAAEYIPNQTYANFKEYVLNCAREYAIHAKVLPIIQSSGTGKTRALDFLAESIFTIPICLRREDEAGYPAGDHGLYNTLCTYDVLMGAPTASVRMYFACVLLRLFESVSAQVRASSQYTAAGWKQHFEKIRRNLYNEVASQCSISAARQMLFNYQPSQSTQMPTQYGNTLATATRAMQNILRDLCTIIADLQSRIAVANGGESTIVLYFDEGHNLNRGVTISNVTAVMADLLEMNKLPFLIVMTSTSSELAAPAKRPGRPFDEYDNSARSFQSIDRPYLQPWSPFAWNIGLRSFIETEGALNVLPVSRIRSEAFAIARGRPIWWGHYKNGWNAKRTIEFAMAKLLGRPSVDPRHLEPLLLCRLALGFSMTLAGKTLANAMVYNHMALTLYVPTHGEHLYATYGSDPTLAWAAQLAMAECSEDELLRELFALYKTEQIERGRVEELITKYILMRAVDKSNGPGSSITLGAFFGNLEADVESLGSALPYLDTSPHTPLSKYFGATLCFAQWISCEKESFGIDMALEALLCHAGLVAPSRQEAVDLMLVLALDEARPATKDNLLVILIQTKNRQQQNRVSITSAALAEFKEQGIPIICLLHEVEANTKQSAWSTSAIQSESTHQLHGSQSDRAPVYYIKFDGCPPKFMPALVASNLWQAQEHELTETGKMLESDVLQMQPFLSKNEPTLRSKYEASPRTPSSSEASHGSAMIED